MRDVDVIIFVEHKDREMAGSLKIAKTLLDEYKLDVVIASIEFGFGDAFFNYNPKVVCLPYCRASINHIVNAFKTRNSNILFLNLNYEQILNSATIKFKTPKDEFAKKELYHLAWGMHFKKLLLNYGVEEKHIYITGKPELYFLLELKNNSLQLKENMAGEFGLSKEKRWCFLPMNDGHAFIPEEKIRKDIARGRRVEEALGSHLAVKRQVEILLNWISCFSEIEENSAEIILRPHPGVSVEQYEELINTLGLKKPECLHIIRDYSIKEWLCASDICMTNWSTSIVDALAIGLESYVFQPEPIPDSLNYPLLDACPKVLSYEDFICRVSGKTITQSENDELSFINEYIDLSKNPISEIAQYIHTIYGKYIPEEKRETLSAIKKEFLHIIRSIFRKKSYQTVFWALLVKKGIRYDFFEDIHFLKD